MNQFQIGETIILKDTIKKSGVLYDPVTSVKISVYRIDSTTPLVNDVTVTAESVGVYPYSFQSAGYAAGKYRYRFTATDGAKITKSDDAFKVD